MKSSLKLLAVFALALLVSAPTMFAQTPETSTLPVTEPLDVGGTVLQPGTYLIRVLRSFADRNKVQITSPDRSVVYVTALTVPHQLEPNEEVPNATFIYYPAGEGMPAALRTWFAPNPHASQGGHDIIYEESRAKQLARLAKSPVVGYRTETAVAELDTTPLEVVTPAETTTYEPYVPPPVTVAEVTPAPMTTTTTTTTLTTEPAPAPMMSSETSSTTQVAEATTPDMPQTAGRTPLIALLGLISLVGAAAFRMARS